MDVVVVVWGALGAGAVIDGVVTVYIDVGGGGVACFVAGEGGGNGAVDGDGDGVEGADGTCLEVRRRRRRMG